MTNPKHGLVRHLALAMDVGHAFVAEFDRPTMRARTLAFWSRGAIRDNIRVAAQ